MRVPFTPGLIPKRRDELATSLGKTVVKHLLTPEGMRKRLLDEQVGGHITDYVQGEVRTMLRSDNTIRSLIEPLYPDAETRVLAGADTKLRQELRLVLADVKSRKLYEILGEDGMDRVRGIIPEIVDALLVKSEEYFYSVEGEAQLRHMVDSFVQRRLGFIAGFVQNLNFVEMIRPEIINILRGSSTRSGMAEMITREFERFSERSVDTLLDDRLEERLIDGVTTEVVLALAGRGVARIGRSTRTRGTLKTASSTSSSRLGCASSSRGSRIEWRRSWTASKSTKSCKSRSARSIRRTSKRSSCRSRNESSGQ